MPKTVAAASVKVIKILLKPYTITEVIDIIIIEGRA